MMEKRNFLQGIIAAGMTSQVPWAVSKSIDNVQLIVPFSAGGLADTFARMIAAAIERRGRYNIVVTNRPGATGMVAAAAALRSRSDELVFVLTATGQLIQPMLTTENSLSKETLNGLSHAYLLCQQDSFMVVSGNANIRNLADFRAKFKKELISPNLGSLGVGSVGHLLGTSLAKGLDLKTVHIPYNGSAGIIQGLMSGDLHYAFMAYDNLRSHVNSNALVPIAVSSDSVSALFPHVPTVKSQGIKFVDRGTWFALAHGKQMNEEILSIFIKDFSDVLIDPIFLMGMKGIGLKPDFKKGKELDDFLSSEISFWRNRITEIS
jgi:tripartite-type tricarboxylate transporter receptor subunit TctC